MQIGDQVPVNINGEVVAFASLKALKDGNATLVIPATVVTMSVTDASKTDVEDVTETVIPDPAAQAKETVVPEVKETVETETTDEEVNPVVAWLQSQIDALLPKEPVAEPVEE